MELDGLSMVRKAAKLAVYEETIINVKNHQIADIVRVLRALSKEKVRQEIRIFYFYFSLTWAQFQNLAGAVLRL